MPSKRGASREPLNGKRTAAIRIGSGIVCRGGGGGSGGMVARGLARRRLDATTAGGSFLSTGVDGLVGEGASDDTVVGVTEKGSELSGMVLRFADTWPSVISGGRF